MPKSAVVLILAALFLCGCSHNAAPIQDGKYYAVFLTNGGVYFGQLSGFGTPYPVLTDVYYVRDSVNQEAKVAASTLIKRGREWHSPDRMILNEKAIAFIEPVGKDSRVYKLIEESKKKPN